MADVQRALRSWWVVGGTAEASISDGGPGIYPLTNPVAGFSYQYTLVGSKSDLFCMKMKKNHIQPMTNQNLSLVPDPSLLPNTHCAKMRQQVLLLLTKRSPRVKWPRPPLFRQVQLTLTVVAPGHFIITWHNWLKIHQKNCVLRRYYISSLNFFYFQMKRLERSTIWGVKGEK